MEEYLKRHGYKLRYFGGVPVWEQHNGAFNVDVMQGRHGWKCYFTDGDTDVCKTVDYPEQLDLFIRNIVAQKIAERI